MHLLPIRFKKLSNSSDDALYFRGSFDEAISYPQLSKYFNTSEIEVILIISRTEESDEIFRRKHMFTDYLDKYHGTFTPNSILIEAFGRDEESLLDVLEHELQHYIQFKTGMPSGYTGLTDAQKAEMNENLRRYKEHLKEHHNKISTVLGSNPFTRKRDIKREFKDGYRQYQKDYEQHAYYNDPGEVEAFRSMHRRKLSASDRERVL